MPAMLKRNLLIIALAMATIVALLLPAPGQFLVGLTRPMFVLPELMPKLGVISACVVVIFLCQGAGLNLKEDLHFGHQARAIGVGAIVAHGLAPLFGWIMVSLLGWQDDSRVGFLLMCAMAPTLASGIIIAVQAEGDRLTAVLLTVAMNLLSIITIPLNLGWTLGSAAHVPQLNLLVKLITLILVPALIGQAFRRLRPDWAERHATLIKNLPVLALAITVYVSLSPQVQVLRELSILKILVYVLPSLAVHLALFAAAYGGGRLAKLPVDVRRSLAICCSQKTLPVAIALWAGTFRTDYPLAFLPCIVFHLSQIYCDGFIAKRMAARSAALREEAVVA